MIPATHLHAVPMRNVQTASVLVFRSIKGILIPDVGQSALSVMTVLEIKLVSEIDVLIHAREHAVKMLFAMSSTTFQCVLVLKA
jgi:hypothetical protein